MWYLKLAGKAPWGVQGPAPQNPAMPLHPQAGQNPLSLQSKQHPSKTLCRTAKAAGYLSVRLTFCVTEESLTQSILEKPTLTPTITARASFVPTATDATPITWPMILAVPDFLLPEPWLQPWQGLLRRGCCATWLLDSHPWQLRPALLSQGMLWWLDPCIFLQGVICSPSS